MASVAVFTLPHCTTEEVELDGFILPKDTQVWFNLYQMNYNAELWDEPNVFKPERFINEKGDVEKPQQWVPYSIGIYI